jgi:hypothetical protein
MYVISCLDLKFFLYALCLASFFCFGLILSNTQPSVFIDHDSCTKDMGVLLADSNMSGPSFCGKSCKEVHFACSCALVYRLYTLELQKSFYKIIYLISV